MGENFRLTVKKSNIQNENKIYMCINSASDMDVRKRLTISRPCPHQRHSLKENYVNSSKIIVNS